MTHEEKTPPAALVEPEEPPRRARRYLGQTPRDLLEEALIVALTGLILGWGYLQLPQVPPAYLPLSYALLAMAAMLGGISLAYRVLRRAILDLSLYSTELLDLGRLSQANGRAMLASMRTMIDDAYTIGRQAERTAWVAIADEAQVRIDELERDLAARQQYPAAGPDLRKLAAQVADLRRTVEEILAADPGQDEELAELQAGIAAINAKADALAAEIARQDQRRHTALDRTDQRILALLSADPRLTDETIGRDPGVSLERSQVTRRRKNLATLGYTVAQKRQGQRPSTR
jgi:hypothetical protein